MPEQIMKELGRDPAYIHSRESASFADPVVSFCCPTYGTITHRPGILEEMLYWYRRQTYPHRELLILNDAPDQKIHVSGLLQAEGVRVVNFPYRIPTLGDKRNMLVMMAIGSIILPQDDDDISLPKRAEQAVKMLKAHDYWSPQRWWYYRVGSGKIKAATSGVGHNCSAYRRAAFYNRYRQTSGNEDKMIHEWATAGNVRWNDKKITDDRDITYVYRWGIDSRHISGYAHFGNMQEIYDHLDAGPSGDYELVDRKATDWNALHLATVAEEETA